MENAAFEQESLEASLQGGAFRQILHRCVGPLEGPFQIIVAGLGVQNGELVLEIEDAAGFRQNLL